MKRAAVLIALMLTLLVPVPAAAVAPALECAHPTKLTGYQDGIAFPGGYRVNQDVWTGVGKQTMYVCSPRDWKAIAKQKGEPETGVKTYPASERTYTDWATCASQPKLSSFTKLKSTYSHVSPPASKPASFNWTYDLFIGAGACSRPLTEVMIFTDVRNVDLPTPQLHTTIDGVKYDIFYAPFTTALLAERIYHRPAATISPALTGGYYVQMRLRDRARAGSADFVKVFKYLDKHDLLTMSDTMMFLRYGVEILTTYNKDVPFVLNGFSVADAPHRP